MLTNTFVDATESITRVDVIVEGPTGCSIYVVSVVTSLVQLRWAPICIVPQDAFMSVVDVDDVGPMPM
eukprot:SAG31_NODE_1340_length_8709_cov_8.259117_6_plen_68_part_00